MGAFWTDAASLLETAGRASQSGSPDCDWAILIGPDGGIHVLEAAGWTLSGLLAQHGARTVYRVTRQCGSVRLEGRSGADACLLRSESPAAAARCLLYAAPCAPPQPAAGWPPLAAPGE